MTDGNEKLFTFTGEATVSVTCYIEADSKEQALEMIESGDCEWTCDDVDGDVTGVELVFEE